MFFMSSAPPSAKGTTWSTCAARGSNFLQVLHFHFLILLFHCELFEQVYPTITAGKKYDITCAAASSHRISYVTGLRLLRRWA